MKSRFDRRDDGLGRRIAAVRGTLATSLAKAKPIEEIHALAKDLDLLQSLKRRRTRRESLRWAICALVSIVALAMLLAGIELEFADTRIVADTQAFLLSSGSRGDNLLIDSVPLTSIRTERANGADCWHVPVESWLTCETRTTLRLNTLTLNMDSTVAIRADGKCFEVDVVNGGTSVDLTSKLVAANDEGQWTPDHLTLAPGEFMRICSNDSKPVLRFGGSASVVLSRRTGVAVSDQELMPALTSGVLTIKTTEDTTPLFKTDMLRIAKIQHSLFVATMADPISLSLDGRVGSLDVIDAHGAPERSLMPTALDWIASSRTAKIATALLGAIASFVIALRERLLSEL